MSRLPIYYYCTRHELDAMGWNEEPGVPHGSDISDPRLLQKPTIFLKPGEPPRGMQDIDTAAMEARLAEHDAQREARLAEHDAQREARLAEYDAMTELEKQAHLDAMLSDADLVDPTDPPPAPSPEPAAATPPAPYTPPPFLPREHGWTPERQSRFLAAIAEGCTVEAACRVVGLSVNSAYKLRRSAAGAAFALGWNGALLIHRGALADSLLARAHDGQEVTWTKADGQETKRHFFDNRLGLAMLTRLDRIAEAQKAEGSDHAAQLVAQDFDGFLAMMQKDASPARAGLFLARRTALELPEDFDDEEVPVAEAAAALWSSPQLAPVATLARADLYTRTGASLPQEIDVSDLDYDKRADWTAEQWQRAHAAGLLAPLPFKGGAGGGCGRLEENEEDEEPHNQYPNPPKPPRPMTGIEGRIWIDPEDDSLTTNFPPPEDFVGYESHVWGHPDYERQLSWDEEALVEARRTAQMIEVSAPDAALRDQWFAQVEDGTSDVLALYAPPPATEAGPVEPAEAEAPEESAAAEALPPPNRKSRRTASARRRARRKGGDAGAETSHAA